MNKLKEIKNLLLYPEDKNKTPDIYNFQETGSTHDVERFWNGVLPDKKVYSHGTTHCRGVLLGVHPSSSIQLKSSVLDVDGRYVVAECQFKEELFTVMSIYLEPTLDPQEYGVLLSSISEKVEQLGHNRVVWLGDFNTVINPSIDTTSIYTYHNQQAKSKRTLLHSLIDTHELTDVWRAMNPNAARFTVRTTLPGGARYVFTRTDFFSCFPCYANCCCGINYSSFILF